ncbi:MAG: hypothetical protein LUI60_04075 [Clostridia bacterium]|nr:hypothetical protein [Clostridia bacterium]
MENKKTEKFALLNLIRALSGQYDQTGANARQDGENAETVTPPANAAPAAEDDNKPNLLAGVIERHEKISYRLKSNKNNVKK